MSKHAGTPALIDDEEIGWVPEPRQRREPTPAMVEAEARRYARAEAALARRGQATAGRPVVICAKCGRPSDPVKRAKNGTAYCHPCAEQMVLAYYDANPEQRPDAAAQVHYKQYVFALIARNGKVWRAAPYAKDYLGKPMPEAIKRLTALGAHITWLQPEHLTRRERAPQQPGERFTVLARRRKALDDLGH
jgi:hypothetical protein